jgi:rubrerythrin
MINETDLDRFVDVIDILWGRKNDYRRPPVEMKGLPYFCCPICGFTLPGEEDHCPLHNAKAIIKYNTPTQRTRGIFL